MTNLKICVWLLVITMGSISSMKNREENDAQLIDKLEKSLLQLFGLSKKPKVDKTEVKIHPYMYQLYNQKVKQNLDERETDEESERKSRAFPKYSSYVSSNTVRSFTHTDSIDDSFYPSHKMRFRFNVSSIPSSELLRAAELRIMHFRHSSLPFFNHSRAAKCRKWSKKELPYLHRIHVYDVVRPAKGPQDPIYRLLDTRVVDARVNDTASFDVSSSLVRWLSKSYSNHGIYVEVLPLKNIISPLLNDTNHVRIRRDANSKEVASEWSEEQPLLVVHTDDQNIKPKEKRSAPAAPFKRTHCQRYSLYVDFRKVDWTTWIVAPPGYDAFFCQGECPYPLAKHMNATNHAVIQNIIHSRYPNRVPSACCVPIKHSAISMLYLDSNKKVVLKTYQDMIVESCGCQ